MLSSSLLVGCKSSLSSLKNPRAFSSSATLFNTKRALTSINHRRPQYARMTPLFLGGIRQHGGHHHHDADLVNSLKSSSVRGTRITIIGLASNVGLTVTKGVAGWMMNSASLLAEAFHSFSDLLSDFVTLYTFKMSRKPADSIYPYGYGKFETVGSVTVSSLLLAGAVGIGFHSFDLLIQTLQTSPLFVSDTTATVAAVASTSVAESSPSVLGSHGHGHGHGGVLDPNAAWFALASVVIKEWLYRATIKVGVSERSEVLIANAWHHRSDAYSSAVALVAIVGSYAGMPVLDPLGGIVVSMMLCKSSVRILGTSIRELMDKGITPEELNSIKSAISKVKDEELALINFHSVRGRKQGPFNQVDLVLQLSPTVTMQKAHQLEEQVRNSVRENCDNIQNILIYLEDAAAVPKKDNHQHHQHHHHHHE